MRASLLGHVKAWPEFPRILPFALLLTGIAIDASWTSLPVSPDWDMRWNYGLRNLAALLALLWLRPLLPELTAASPSARNTALALLVGLGVFLLWVAPPLAAFAQSAGGFDAHLLLSGPQAAAGSGFTPLNPAGELDWGLAASRLAGSALVVPVAEELFWRSFLMRSIDHRQFDTADPRRLSLRAFALQALCFGAEHDLWLAGIVAGLAYGWLYRTTGRLWPAIVAHALTNALLGLWVLQTGRWAYW